MLQDYTINYMFFIENIVTKERRSVTINGIFKNQIDDYRQLVSKCLLPNETFYNEKEV